MRRVFIHAQGDEAIVLSTNQKNASERNALTRGTPVVASKYNRITVLVTYLRFLEMGGGRRMVVRLSSYHQYYRLFSRVQARAE